jgi:hypothetical protein
MGKSYMSSFFASIFGLTHPIGGEGGVCKYTSAKDMHCYAEKHNAMRVMVRWGPTLGDLFPLSSLGPFFFFKISGWALKMVGASVTYRVMCFFGACAGVTGKLTCEFSEWEEYDFLASDCAFLPQ